MNVFKSEKYFPIRANDLDAVARDVMEDFRAKQFEVAGDKTIDGAWDIRLHKASLFRTIMGQKMALKIEIERVNGGTYARAGIDGFLSQGLTGGAALLLMPATWVLAPVLALSSLWGAVRNAKLDDEAMSVVEQSLYAHAGGQSPAGTAPTDSSAKTFCTSCGAALPGPARFCPACGAKHG